MTALATAEQLLISDLSKSGLTKEALGAYLAQEAELTAVGIRPHLYLDNPAVHTPGYVIPYYDIGGTRAPFYRVRLFEPLPKGPRYLQPANSGSWLYFPKSFAALAKQVVTGKCRTNINGFAGAIIITEGEKKASKACIEGFPTCAVGGVFNWRTRTIVLPEGTQLLKNRENQIIAKVEKGTQVTPTSDRKAFLATGLLELIKFVMANNLQIVIAFDGDHPQNKDVQAAAAELAFEFRVHGVPTHRIRQLLLPNADNSKVGLDDFLRMHGPTALDSLLEQCMEQKTAFPEHPNLRGLINRHLDGQLTRNEAKELSLMILSDMDRHGSRMIEAHTRDPYFFDGRSKTLMPVNLLTHHSEPLHETKFGSFLYRHYDVGQADLKLVQWLAAGFTGEEPVSEIVPRSIVAMLPNERLAYQISDGQFAIVSADDKKPLQIVDNGTEGVLFKADQVEPLNPIKLVQEFQKQVKLLENPNYESMNWVHCLKNMKFCRPADAKLLSVLYYMSPWFLHWKGTQLPVELVIGEAGSGKSTLCSLRLRILSGRPALRNQPTDIRDWYASITSADGLHATDNVHMVNKDMRQRLSDEICRIVTEPAPYVEMRKLFTTSDNFRIPVRTVFVMTAIQQPFLNADILQRSLVTELLAIGNNFSSGWDMKMLEQFGGREGWIAHHLAVIHHVFKRIKAGGWNQTYKSSHRLANFEQLFLLFGQTIGLKDAKEMVSSFGRNAEGQVSEYDWVMAGLKDFNLEHIHIMKDPTRTITLQDVSAWAMTREEYEENSVLTNARRLSRYIKSHNNMVTRIAGFKDAGKSGNREAYRLTQLTPT